MKNLRSIPPIIIAYFALLAYDLCGFLAMYSEKANLIKLPASIVVLWSFFTAKKNYNFDTSKQLVIVFITVTIFVLFRGSLWGNFPVADWIGEVHGVYGIVRVFLVNPFGGLSYVIMLFVLIPFNKKELCYYRHIAFFCSLFCIINCIIFHDALFDFTTRGKTELESALSDTISIRTLTSSAFVGMGAILLSAFSANTFKKLRTCYLSMIVVVLFSVAGFAGGSRGATISAFINIGIMLMLYLKGTRDRKPNKAFTMAFRTALVSVFVYIFYDFIIQSHALDFVLTRFFYGGQVGDFVESNRTIYINAVVNELNVHPWAWIIGKGINASYMLGTMAVRSNIENGFMHLILRGGIVHLVLYVCILLRAAYLGYFKSNNLLSKAMAAMCFLRLYSLFIFGLPMVVLEFLMVWHFIRLLNTNEFRMMSDIQVKQLINRK